MVIVSVIDFGDFGSKNITFDINPTHKFWTSPYVHVLSASLGISEAIFLSKVMFKMKTYFFAFL